MKRWICMFLTMTCAAPFVLAAGDAQRLEGVPDWKPVPVRAQAGQRISLPPDAILAAAKKIRPQTSERYSAKGRLVCDYIAGEFDLRAGHASCKLTMDGKTVEVENIRKLLPQIMAAIPPRGPAYHAEGDIIIECFKSKRMVYMIVED